MPSLSNISGCNRKDNNIIFGINILMHITFLISILSYLFVFHTSTMIENTVNNQIADLINDNITKYEEKPIKQIKKYISNTNLYKIKQIFELDDSQRTNNNNLIKKILLLVILAFILMLILTILVAKGLCSNISVKEILIENIVIFTIIPIVEILFFLNIILKYIPSYPSENTKIILQVLKNN